MTDLTVTEYFPLFKNMLFYKSLSYFGMINIFFSTFILPKSLHSNTEGQ